MIPNKNHPVMRQKPEILIVLWRTFYLFIVFTILLISCKDKAATKKEKQLPVFEDVTSEAGLSGFRHDNGARGKVYFPEQMGSGGGFVDYDGDNWLDILLVGGGPIDSDKSPFVNALRLYKNNRNGTFTEVTEEAGLYGIQIHGQGITAADYDNDGDEDFFFTTLRENYLFRNDGGVFKSVGKDAGVADQSSWSTSAIFFDADRDGDLDLYVANYADWTPETDIFCSVQGVVSTINEKLSELSKKFGRKAHCSPSEFPGIGGRFYRNKGDGTFKDETNAAGFLPSPGKSLGVAECDYNQDGWPDIIVANDIEADQLYKNNGDGTFTEIGKASGMAFGDRGESRAGMGIDAGVVDKSGRETFFVGNFSSEMIGVYKYSGHDLFRDRASASKIGIPSYLSLTFGLFLFDADYDGDLDLFVANGHIWAIRPSMDGSTYRQKSQLFLNKGNGIFTHLKSVPGNAFGQKMVARASSYGDYDRDGDLDILLTENNGPAHLWRNELNAANYLRVRLQGEKSNAEGISSQIVATVNGTKMYRRMRTGSSYLSQSEKVVSFGLGEIKSVDSLLVQWPSGQEDLFTDLEANQELKLIEGTSQYQVVKAY